MPMLHKKSTVAVHFYANGGARLLQKIKAKPKGRGRPKTTRSIVLLDAEDIKALAPQLAKHLPKPAKVKAKAQKPRQTKLDEALATTEPSPAQAQQIPPAPASDSAHAGSPPAQAPAKMPEAEVAAGVARGEVIAP